jgi:hypothetical protein
MHRSLYVLILFLLVSISSQAIPIIYDTIPSNGHHALPEINIKGNAMVAKRRGDTLVFAADRFKRADAIKLEELLKHVPGFRVDENGRISFNGKEIKKLLLDGEDLTAENYQLLSRNLRSLMIDSIQVVEKFNDKRLLKDIENKEDIAVNLVLKKSFYGKPNFNFVGATALKKNGELQAELVQLGKYLKQLLFINTNDIGSKSLTQTTETNSIDPEQKGYKSWPLEIEPILNKNIPNLYVYQNRDWSSAWTSNFKINSFNKLKLNFKTINNQLFTDQVKNDLFKTQDTSLINIYSASTTNYKINHQSIGAQWEKDKGKNTTSNYSIELFKELREVVIVDKRDEVSEKLISSTSRLYSKGLQIENHQLWQASKNCVWKWEGKINLHSHQYSIAILPAGFSGPDVKDSVISQEIAHQTLLVQTGIGYFRDIKKTKFQFGGRASFETLTSSNGDVELQLKIIKQYVYAHMLTRLSKKFMLENQWMIGFSNFMFGIRKYKALIYHVEQSLVWRKKQTDHLRFSYGVLKKPVDARSFYAGPILTTGSTNTYGAQLPTFPLSLYVQLQVSKMDLYRGLMIGGYTALKYIYYDYMMAVEMQPYFSSIITILGSRQTIFSMTAHLEKVIHAPRLKYRLQLTGAQNAIPSQFNKQQFISFTRFARIDNSISTNWRKGYNFQFEYYYTRSLFSGFTNDARTKNFTHEYKFGIQMYYSSKINALIGVSQFSGRGFVHLQLLDLKLNLTANSKYRIYVYGTNLLDRKVFIQQVIGANSIGDNRQTLIGRRVVVGVDIPL